MGEHRRPSPGAPEPSRRGLPVLRRRSRSARPVRRALVREPLARVRARSARSTSPAAGRGHDARSRGRRVRGRVVLARARRSRSRRCPSRRCARSSTSGRNARPRCSRGPRSSTCWCSRTAAARSARRSTIRTARSTAIRSCRRHRHAKAAVAREHGCALCAELAAETGGRDTRSSPPPATGWRGCRTRRSHSYGMRIASRARTSASLADARRHRTRRPRPRCSATRSAATTGCGPRRNPATGFPYLLWFHQAPAAGGDEWHLHAHVAPPLRAPGRPALRRIGRDGQRHALESRRPRDGGRARCATPDA